MSCNNDHLAAGGLSAAVCATEIDGDDLATLPEVQPCRRGMIMHHDNSFLNIQLPDDILG
ncbi:hypothetical protein DSM14862_03322 (plasmid) [Sulfitobacter indolifex]|nr:hypothetical protein DSM14862_03322 [Sulfitobacter indolifex]